MIFKLTYDELDSCIISDIHNEYNCIEKNRISPWLSGTHYFLLRLINSRTAHFVTRLIIINYTHRVVKSTNIHTYVMNDHEYISNNVKYHNCMVFKSFVSRMVKNYKWLGSI